MARVKRGMAAHARHRKILTLAKGFRGRSSTCFRPALERLEKSWQYAYRDRRTKKRDIRALWIQRINAAVRQLGMKYSTFINGLAKKNVIIDRKTLSKFAMEDPVLFRDLVALANGSYTGAALGPSNAVAAAVAVEETAPTNKRRSRTTAASAKAPAKKMVTPKSKTSITPKKKSTKPKSEK
jgi:large subunit ribosomal protein L20